ncbi:hypothetical protein CNMCM8980_010298 [Aspergillus fumigatiaffinis]|uniref:Septin-type G domain-containing protein n=1 Tax=Aspergillus fumigatiaffinis TaxID=340414 RepID=A0A8H4GKH9_9EURO|nr:hypothetical protein CNMCM6457_010179 [Aspergillus fumigatiaffinis]KAF4231655.1 hypothetical protein CNMCM6805_000001 [Aspergillus fumigatiaffinis]KAF4244236.1 hypothetical protein CNMCM8980_010298 [Aspergillus fumigatiaffinis]
MRPPVPEVSMPRSRKSSIEQPWTDPRSTAPATFFLARSHTSHSDELALEDSDVSKEYMYGVQSLEDSVQEASISSSQNIFDRSTSDRLSSGSAVADLRPDINLDVNENSSEDENGVDSPPLGRRRSTIRQFDSLRTEVSLQPPSDRASSRPPTPLNPDEPSSLPSSPKSVSNQSMKHLDDISITDDLSSHAVGSEDEGNDARETLNSAGFDSTSQLIMPSIRMPSRRPFTDRGKTMGRFKVLIAGACGSGKTSLIKSIVQACEDIVHVDPFPSLSPSNLSARAQPPTTAAVISEIYASTKPYPPWWSDLEDSRVLRRRKSSGDIVLERNLCFVDTAGNGSSRVGQTDAIIRHIQQQLLRATTAVNSSNTDFENLLAGNGGAQVDAVLYLISENTLAADIECIRKLCAWTNVIPLISKSDLLTPDQIATLKSSFHAKAQMASIKPFHFGDATSAAADGFSSHSPFAISSAKVDDEDVMDASTLMSPDYVQPLAPSELSLLVQKLFDLDNMAWIRHSAAKKLVQRQHDQGQQWEVSRHSTNPFDGQSTVSRSTSSVISASYLEGITSPPSGRFPSYTMARISDYTQREEKMARVQLAKWASDLQRSLQNERERYAALARGERAVWLTERLGECVVDGSLVPITKNPGFCGLRLPTDNAGGRLFVRTQDGKKMEYRVTSISPHDPLGIVWWSDDLKQRGWAIVQIVGSLGVVGGLAFWLAKAWGLSSRSLSEWRFDCCSTCN